MTPETSAPAWRTDDLTTFRDAVRKRIESAFVPRLPAWRAQGHPDRDAWRAAGAAGLLLTDIPEQYGGGGGTYAHEVVVLEELARAGVAFGVREQSIVAHYLLAYGTESQKAHWLPQLARGIVVAAIAMTEPVAGSDLLGMRTMARREGDHYRVDGAKTFITNGAMANLVCLCARTDPADTGPTGLSMLLLDTTDLDGYRVGTPLEKLGMDEQDTCELFLDDVHVSGSALLGGEGDGFFQMMEQLPRERLTIAVAAQATIERAVELTGRYVKERTAFGKPLLDLQNTRFVLADCLTDARVGRAFVDDCVSRHLAGTLDPVTAAMAKYWVTSAEGRILDACLQLHGGYGYMLEYPIARMWADARYHRIGGGTSEIMRELIGWSV